MFAQSYQLETRPIRAFPALMLILVFICAALGVVAHVAFA